MSNREPRIVSESVTDEHGEVGMYYFRAWGVISNGDKDHLHNLDDNVFDALPNAIIYARSPHLKFYRTREEAMSSLRQAERELCPEKELGLLNEADPIEYLAEQARVVHFNLDRNKVPRIINGQRLSLWGRIHLHCLAFNKEPDGYFREKP